MKPENELDSERLLERTLKEWRVEDPLPPAFREKVWRRIDRGEIPAAEGLWARLSSWINRSLSRPALAASYVAVLLMAGLATGYWQARTDNARVSQELRGRYVRMMDPYRMARH
jgi:hypothetical protein